jgi:RND superfamily putative drug exporter
MGRWSAAHWKTAALGWLAFVVAAVVIGGVVGTKQLGDTAAPGESGRMAAILDDAFERPAEESVLVESEKLTVDDPAFAAAVDDVVALLRATAVVRALQSPLAESDHRRVLAVLAYLEREAAA